ncbi:MAG: glycosyltransferase family 4 protein [Chloroflexi bacterium]|nr:glycosyltransferase family 4 protein [Chloroflexota bacterium]MBI3341360.1 glycosyltransferase family 4 protein [Chloroflexota bacterium]
MRLCFVCIEIFAWGKYGGFGRATRSIGRELARRGVDVSAVIPRRADQRPLEMLDGIRVLGFEPGNFAQAFRLYRDADADIYHSEEPSFGTFVAQKAMPHRKHIVTFRDTRDARDWRIESDLPTLSRFQVWINRVYEDNFLVHRAVRQADARFAASYVVARKAQLKYRLRAEPIFLPTPVDIPEKVQKADQPTVCFMARWDKRKRPEIFLELARQFPDVKFIAVGVSRNRVWDEALRARYADLSNLEMTGFLDQFDGQRHDDVLARSWILINTSAREGLPVSFVEAAAHRCAILSSVNPDDFASRFGYFAERDDFVNGLRFLLENNRWRASGEQAFQHARGIFAAPLAIQKHLEIYQALLSG